MNPSIPNPQPGPTDPQSLKPFRVYSLGFRVLKDFRLRETRLWTWVLSAKHTNQGVRMASNLMPPRVSPSKFILCFPIVEQVPLVFYAGAA